MWLLFKTLHHPLSVHPQMLHPFPNICYSPPHTSILTIFSCSSARRSHPSLLARAIPIAWNILQSLSSSSPRQCLLVHPVSGQCSRYPWIPRQHQWPILGPPTSPAPTGFTSLCLYLLWTMNSLQVRRGCSALMPQHLAQHLIQSSYSTPCSWVVEWLKVSCSKFSFDFWSPMPLPLGSCWILNIDLLQMKSPFLPVNHKFPDFFSIWSLFIKPTFCARTKGYKDK